MLLLSCSQKDKTASIVIKNTLNFERSFETIALSKDLLNVDDLSHVHIQDPNSGEMLVSQVVDNNSDGDMDEILFQPLIDANSEKAFKVVIDSNTVRATRSNICYSRFVPERTDDYAWENNKVAFRVYGPTAQKMIEANVPGGTLSSGVDAWLKRVEYPIVNKWYKKYEEGTGSYHEDTGEGLDNFHVGVSRGVGGVAVQVDSTYYYSKNYIEYKTITTGPIRTSFYLKYADWNAGDKVIKESKVISLDYGSNLSKFETNISGTNEISVGLTLHEKDGVSESNKERAWLSYWQPHADSEIGTAVLTDVPSFVDSHEYLVNEKDLSNAYLKLNVKNNRVVYYAGFSWAKSEQFTSRAQWEEYLNMTALKIKSPLTIEVVN